MLHSDLELAAQAVDDDLQVELAHAADDRLTGLFVGVRAERGIFECELLKAAPSFCWSALVFGSIAIEMTGSGNSCARGRSAARRRRACRRWSRSCRPTAAQMLPAWIVLDLFALVRVHQEQTADALALALASSSARPCRSELTRVHAQERQLTDERIVHDLECQRRRTARRRRLARSSFPRVSGSSPSTGGMSSGDGR